MIGIDTNILVRYFTQDNLEQAQIVEQIIDSYATSRKRPAKPVLIFAIMLVLGSRVANQRFSLSYDLVFVRGHVLDISKDLYHSVSQSQLLCR